MNLRNMINDVLDIVDGYARDRNTNNYRYEACRGILEDRRIQDEFINIFKLALEYAEVTNDPILNRRNFVTDIAEEVLGMYVPFFVINYIMNSRDRQYVERIIDPRDERDLVDGARETARWIDDMRAEIDYASRNRRSRGRYDERDYRRNDVGYGSRDGGLMSRHQGIGMGSMQSSRYQPDNSTGYFGTNKGVDDMKIAHTPVTKEEMSYFGRSSSNELRNTRDELRHEEPKPVSEAVHSLHENRTNHECETDAYIDESNIRPVPKDDYYLEVNVPDEFITLDLVATGINMMRDEIQARLNTVGGDVSVFPQPIEEMEWIGSKLYDKKSHQLRWYCNKLSTHWVNYDPTEFKAYIAIHASGYPYPVFKRLTKEEKMKMQEHIIPGAAPIAENLSHAGSSVRQNSDVPNIDKQIESLGLSHEQLEEQRKRAEEEGVDYRTITPTQMIPMVVDGEASIVPSVLGSVFAEGNIDVATTNLCITNEVASHRDRDNWIKTITQCDTFAEVKNKVFDNLMEKGEYYLCRIIGETMDKEHDRILSRIGFTEWNVDDIINCGEEFYDEVVSKSSMANTYKTMVRTMLHTFHTVPSVKFFNADGTDAEYKLEKLSENNTIINHTATVLYLNRLESELKISSPIKDGKWFEVDERVSSGEVNTIIKRVLLGRLRSPSEYGEQVYLLTKDGSLFEVMGLRDDDNSRLFMRHAS